MDKRKFLLIVGISAISLVGIIILQFFLIRSAVRLEKNEFNNRVEAGIKLVVNSIFQTRLDTCAMNKFCSPGCNLKNELLPGQINKHLLDSLVRNEFKDVTSPYGFVYGMINPETNTVIYASDQKYADKLLTSIHHDHMTCIFSRNNYALSIYFPDEGAIFFHKLLVGLVVSILLLGMLIFGFLYTIWSFLRQKKLSEMKNDFVNNMTHEFKTPMATISLSSEMLLKPEVYHEESKVKKYARIISEENRRLKAQVENVLQIAVLEKGEYTLTKSEFDLNRMINQLICNYSVHTKERNGNIQFRQRAESAMVFADPIHIQNILSNLIDNANKYSVEAPEIKIETYNSEEGIFVSISDKGSGISAENQKNVFNKLYRVPTGNVYNVKGFGLGLYYVKTMVEAHGGNIRLESQLNKGSNFIVFLPQKNV